MCSAQKRHFITLDTYPLISMIVCGFFDPGQKSLKILRLLFVRIEANKFLVFNFFQFFYTIGLTILSNATDVVPRIFAIIQSTFYKLIKAQQYLKKMRDLKGRPQS